MLQIKTRTNTALILLLLFTSLSVAAYAGQPVIWETNSRTELLRGDARGVSITDTGVLTLAPKSISIQVTNTSGLSRF